MFSAVKVNTRSYYAGCHRSDTSLSRNISTRLLLKLHTANATREEGQKMTFIKILPLISSLLLLLACSGAAEDLLASVKPRALVLNATKDPATKQYVINFKQRTPLVTVKATMDLGGSLFWVDCSQGYISSTLKPIPYKAAPCNLVTHKFPTTLCGQTPGSGCNYNLCGTLIDNRLAPMSEMHYTSGVLEQDVVSLPSSNGSQNGKYISVPKFLFGCASGENLFGLAKGINGMAGFGRTKLSLPKLLSSAFGLPNKFAICLNDGLGVVLIGKGPFVFLSGPPVVFSDYRVSTPLIRNPVLNTDYFIKVTGIKINNEHLAINTSLLEINRQGSGGTMISTIAPYAVFETTIYRAVMEAFSKLLAYARVPAVAPFELCIDTSVVGSTRVGPGIPPISFGLLNSPYDWDFYGGSSLVSIGNVSCLGFLDGGRSPPASIVIGANLLENTLVEFDNGASRLGIFGYLPGLRTGCQGFDFTTQV